MNNSEDTPLVLDYKLNAYGGSKDNKIGAGGYGSIYKYSNDKAIKIMPWSMEYGPSETTILEIAVLKRYRHLNLIRIYDVVLSAYTHTGEQGIGLIMELAIYDLSAVIKIGLSKEEMDIFAYHIMCGLSFLHHHNIMHRDIKPQNILIVEKDGESIAKLTDLGSSAPLECILSSTFNENVYTMWYRPPEILAHKSYSLSADVWALGCTLYELYTGIILFKEYGSLEQLNEIFKQLGSPKRSYWTKGSKYTSTTFPKYERRSFDHPLLLAIEDMILSCLQYEPEKRPTVFELLSNSYFDLLRTPEREYNIRPCSATIDDKDIIVYPPSLDKYTITELQEWVIKLLFHFDLSPRITFLTLKILDLIHERIYVSNLLLLGCISMHLASMLSDEVPSLTIDSYIKLMKKSSTYITHTKFISVVVSIVSALQFDLIIVTPYEYELLDEQSNNLYSQIHKAVLLLITLSRIRYGKSSSYLNTLASYAANKYIDTNYLVPVEYEEDIITLLEDQNPIQEYIFNKYTDITLEEFIETILEE